MAPASACSASAASRIDEEHPGNLIGKTLTLSYATSDASQPSAQPVPLPAPMPMAGALQLNRATVSCTVVGIVERSPGGGIPGAAGLSNFMLEQKAAEAIAVHIVTGPQSLLRDPSQPRTYTSLTVRTTSARFTGEVQDKIRTIGFGRSRSTTPCRTPSERSSCSTSCSV
jgi:hypothetical protein